MGTATEVVARPLHTAAPDTALKLFSTCFSSNRTPDHYPERIVNVSRWSEAAGCAGMLVYTDNSVVDAWMVAQVVIQNTRSLAPLVAVQPAYMHPYTVAKMVSTLAFLYGRRIFLNMVAGGFKNDLLALGDDTAHDRRYERLVEYTRIIRGLLESHAPVTLEGGFYQVKALTMNPKMPPELAPGILMSGSSDAGMAAAKAAGAVVIKYPEPPQTNAAGLPPGSGPCGVRLGIVARESEDAAWDVALKRFPDDRRGQLLRQMANKVSDSSWHKQLMGLQSADESTRQTYWLHPFENYQTNCPYLVGNYENVTTEISRYMDLGYRTFILDIPASEEEFDHIRPVFEAAAQRSGVEW